MLRRKPTALTITSEDIIAFEEARLRQQQLRQQELLQQQQEERHKRQQQQHQQGLTPENVQKSGQLQQGAGEAAASSLKPATNDPSDELKPLPGDKARIVRSRDERIVGPSTRRG
jgi:hypothetical protein